VKKYCVMPWIGLEVNNNGNLRPCCVYKDQIRDEQGKTFNINNNTIEEYANSKSMIELKEKLINGQEPWGCIKCYEEESLNVASLRQRKNKYYKDYITKSVEAVDLISVDLKLSNLCNQKCVICNTGASSLLASENKQILPELNIDWNKTQDLYHWYKKDEVWSELEAKTQATQHFDFFGGEPWLIKKQWEFLKHLIDSDRCKWVSLNYATNGSIHDDAYFTEYFSKFRDVSILYSGDGIENSFEYNRFPGKWETYKNNVLKAKKFQVDNSISWMGVAYTVSAYSIHNVIEAMDFYTKNNVEVWFNMVNEDELCAGVLPDDVKKAIRKNIKEGWRSDFTTLDKNIDTAFFEQQLDREVSSNWKKVFVKKTNARDKFRGVDFTKLIPMASLKEFLGRDASW